MSDLGPTQNNSIEEESQLGPADLATYKKRWITELDLAKKEFKSWATDVQKVFERYQDKRNRSLDYFDTTLEKKFNILWSNTNILQPLLYSRTPIPQVERRHKDSDVVGRLTSEVLERGIEYNLKSYDYDETMRHCVLDNLLAGRGTARVCYYPAFGNQLDPMTGQTIQQIIDQQAKCEYVHHSDFRHGPARTWDEVNWVGFRHFFSRDDLRQHFGQDVGNAIKLNFTPLGMKGEEWDGPKEDLFKKAEVWEVWDKGKKEVVWVTDGYGEALRVDPDPLHLKDFFPCPKPLYATLSTSSLVPTPDFLIYIDQARELDIVTNRIFNLLRTIRNVMIRDASLEELDRIFSDALENDIIPCGNWSALVKQGGIEGSLFALPNDSKIKVIMELYQARQNIINEIYEITGMSDIVRGASDPSETATAQQLKGQYANLRISARQADVQRFARDLVALTGEIISEQFTPDIIREISNYDMLSDANPQDPQEWQSIIQLIKNDPLRRFRITIETDSTIAIDEQMEKQQRSEFLQSVGQFMGQVLPFAQQFPAMAPIITEMVSFAARGFKAGRQLESVMDAALGQFRDQLMQPQQPQQPPDPMQDPGVIQAQIKAQTDQQGMQLKLQEIQASHATEMQKIQAQYQIDVAKVQQQAEKDRQDLQLKASELAQATQIRTLQDIQSPSAQGVNVNLNIQKGTKKRIRVARLPTGELVGETEDIPQVEAIPLMQGPNGLEGNAPLPIG